MDQALVSLGKRIPELRQVLVDDPEQLVALADHVQQVRVPLKAAAKLGFAKHPAVLASVGAYDVILTKVLYHADETTLCKLEVPDVVVREVQQRDVCEHADGTPQERILRQYAAKFFAQQLRSGAAPSFVFSMPMEAGCVNTLMASIVPGHKGIPEDTGLGRGRFLGGEEDEFAPAVAEATDVLFMKLVSGGLHDNVIKHASGSVRLTALDLGVTVHRVEEVDVAGKHIMIQQTPANLTHSVGVDCQDFHRDQLPNISS